MRSEEIKAEIMSIVAQALSVSQTPELRYYSEVVLPDLAEKLADKAESLHHKIKRKIKEWIDQILDPFGDDYPF